MKRILRATITFLAGIGLLFVVITITPVTGWWTTKLMGPWNDPPGDILVVLGSDANEDMIGFGSYWRAVYAVRVFRQGGVRNVVLTGGRSPGNDPIALSMARFLESQGVPHEAIILETRASSTRENALFTKPLLANLAGHKVLLTSDFHMWRSIRAFHKVGIDIQPRPIPDLLKQTSHWDARWSAFLGLLKENAKIVYYFLRRWI